MANPNRKVSGNVEGDFYVDRSCINCDTCRQLAPNTFQEKGGYSVVFKQPDSIKEKRKAMQSVISCPTGSIGTTDKYDRQEARRDFPLLLEEPVYYCGFNSPKSYGGNSYFITSEDRGTGNILIDSPRYTPYLVEKFEEMGGINYIFLTHRDDVADAEKYKEYFSNAKVIIHDGDRSAYRSADIIIEGKEPVSIDANTKIIPTPGHTKGHSVLVFDDKFLFSGDHLYWRRDWNGLRATRRMCWYDWDKQVKSMRQLLDYEFEWVLPGHGQRIRLPKEEMAEKLEILVKKMEKSDYW